MALLNKQDSNSTGLRFAEELSIGILPGSPIWVPLEPNSYADFGGEVTKIARRPINPTRQLKKGVAVDLDASGGFNTDLTQSNIQELLQGFLFADMRRKAELAVAIVDGVGEDFEPASGGTGYVANDLLFAKGFADAANNGLHLVTGVPTATSVPVTSNLVTAAAQTGTISRVGRQAASADVNVVITGDFATYTSTVLNFTLLGLIPGEFIFVGGDGAGQAFVNAVNNGYKRIRSISATALVVDKSGSPMVAETGTGLTIRFFFGRVLKNETGTLIKRRTYQLERTLGFPDDALPAEVQAEYLEGQVPNEMTLNLATADKVNVDLTFVGTDHTLNDGPTPLKSGTRPALVEADAFNTSSDFSRLKIASVSSVDEAPTPLVAFMEELTLSLSNNNEPSKALARFGAFEVSSGAFVISGSLRGYFANITALQAVRNNSDVTLDFVLASGNAGIAIDVPLIALGDGRLDVELDEEIFIPLSFEAGTGAKVVATMDHTLLMVFFDFLPNLAM